MQSGKRKLVSIKKVDLPKDTLFCDITISGNHLFQLSNGVISHNCDYSTSKRYLVRKYLEDRFGRDFVLPVATYGGSGIRGALLDLAKAFNIPFQDALAVTKEFDKMTKYDIGGDDDENTATFQWAKDNVTGAKELFRAYPDLERWVPVYEPVYRYIGRHAAALVVCDIPITEIVPLAWSTSGKEPMVALREGSGVKELQPQGVMKFDFLGLNNVDVLHDAEQFIEKRHGIQFNEVEWHRYGFNHSAAYQLAADGELDGIFQLEGIAGRRTTEIVKPQTFQELVFISAAMRPGAAAAKAAETFYAAKTGSWPEGYPRYDELQHYGVDQRLIDFLAETRGIIVYQEQVMQFLHYVGDVPMSFTNKVRKVITIPPEKRKPEHEKIVQKAYKQYMTGAMKRGLSQELAQRWWSTVVGGAGYSFNKCLALNSRVLTVNRGEITACSAEIGEKIWAIDEETGEWFENEITDIVYSGTREIWDVLFDDGTSLGCSLDHKFVVENGQHIPLKDLLDKHLREDIINGVEYHIEFNDVKSKEQSGLPQMRTRDLRFSLYEASGKMFSGRKKEDIEKNRQLACRGVDMHLRMRRKRRAEEHFKVAVGGDDGPSKTFMDQKRARGQLEQRSDKENRPQVKNNSRVSNGKSESDVRGFSVESRVNQGNRSSTTKSSAKNERPNIFSSSSSSPFYFSRWSQQCIGEEISRTEKKNQERKIEISGRTPSPVFQFQARDDSQGVHWASKEIRQMGVRRMFKRSLVRSERKLLACRSDGQEVFGQSKMADRSGEKRCPRRNQVCFSLGIGCDISNYLGRRDQNRFETSHSDDRADQEKTASGPCMPQPRKIVALQFRGLEPTIDLETKGIDDRRGHNFVANGSLVSNSHCVVYTLITYRELFLKAYFPIEFFAALIKHTKPEKMAQVILAAERTTDKNTGMRTVFIEPPDINRSGEDVTIDEQGVILLGLSSLKNMGDIALKDVLERRPYGSFGDFFDKHTGKNQIEKYGKRSRCYKPAMLALIYSNAFRFFGMTRQALLSFYIQLYNGSKGDKQKIEVPSLDDISIMEQERYYTKFVFTTHALTSPERGTQLCSLEQMASFRVNRTTHRFFGMLAKVEKRRAKSGRKLPFWILTVTNFRVDAKIYCWSSGISQLNTIKKDGFTIRKEIEPGDGIEFTAYRTERGSWSLDGVFDIIRDLRKFYSR